MDANVLGVIDALPTGDPDTVLLCLDVQIIAVHTRQFYDGDQIIALLEHIDRGIAAPSRRRILQPIAGKTLLKGTLEGEESVERIGIFNLHRILLCRSQAMSAQIELG